MRSKTSERFHRVILRQYKQDAESVPRVFKEIKQMSILFESYWEFAELVTKQLIELFLYLQQKEIVHRDLKPGNILIDCN